MESGRVKKVTLSLKSASGKEAICIYCGRRSCDLELAIPGNKLAMGCHSVCIDKSENPPTRKKLPVNSDKSADAMLDAIFKRR